MAAVTLLLIKTLTLIMIAVTKKTKNNYNNNYENNNDCNSGNGCHKNTSSVLISNLQFISKVF